MVGAGPAADDVVQDAFVKAFTRLDQFDDGRSFRPWLLAIVANEARNRLRSSGRHAALVLRVAARVDDEATDPAGDPERSHERSELRRRMADAVSALPERDREVIALRYFAELSEAQTAEVLGCAPGTVKSRLSRALDRLRVELGEEVST